MTLTVADIERWDADSVREVFHAASSRAQAAADAADGLATLPAFTSWGGVAAKAARDAIGKTRTDLDAHGREARIVADAARGAADEIDRIGSDLAILKADADLMGMEIDSVSGKVLPGRSVRDPVEALLNEQQLQPRLDEIVAEANLIDMALANAIHMADGSVPFDHPGATPAPADPADVSGQPKNLDAALGDIAGHPVGAPAGAPDSSLNQHDGSGEGEETGSTRSPLTTPIIDADPSVVGRQRARVEAARQTLNAAQAKLDGAAARRYTQGAGSGISRDDTDALSQAVFDARRDLTDQTRILEDLDCAAAASGLPTAAVPALPDNAHVQAFPPQPSAIAEGSRALSEGSLGLIPDVAKDVDIFTNWGRRSGAEQAGAVLDAAGLVPIPGTKVLTGGIGHGLDALNAARHLDDIPTPHPHVDDITGTHRSPDAPHHATDSPGTHHIGDDTGHVASYEVEDITALLATSEAAGGHLMERHVGLTVDDLTARLAARPSLDAVSTFATRDEAAAAVSTTLRLNQSAVETWVANGSTATLALTAPFNGGAVLVRGAAEAISGSSVLVVLKGDGMGNWHILTGYMNP